MLNFITIIFVVVSGYFLVVKNPSVSDALHQYYDRATTELKTLGEKTPGLFSSIEGLGDLGSFSAPLDAPANGAPVTENTVPGKVATIPPKSAPAPVIKISPTQPAPTAKLELTIQGIISATNAQRITDGDLALIESSKLDASAQVKAEDMLKRQYFEHTAPDGKTVSDLAAGQNYAYIKIGENLALGNFKDDADLVQAWMNSPGHRANILDGMYTEIGIGIAHGMYDGRMVYLAVQHFGKPLNSCPGIDATLKARVEKGLAELETFSQYLESLRKAIEQGRAEGKNMDDTVAVYNQGVEKYQADAKIVEALRVQYNNQVAAFNSCAAG